MCQLLHNVLPRDTFIISEEHQLDGGRIRPSALYRVVYSHSIARSRLELVRWRPTVATVPTTAFTVRSHSDVALLSSARANLPLRHRLLIIASYPAPPGLKDLIQVWRKDANRNMVHLITVNNKDSNHLILDELPENDLVFTSLDNVSKTIMYITVGTCSDPSCFNNNVNFQGIWGGEYYVPVQDSAKVSSNVSLQCAKVSDLDSLIWVEAPETDGSGIPVTVRILIENKFNYYLLVFYF